MTPLEVFVVLLAIAIIVWFWGNFGGRWGDTYMM